MPSTLDFTLAAGPVTVWPQVQSALSRPITYHYDPDFLDAFQRTQEKVGRVFGTTNDVLLMQGEAIVALEGAARSLVRPGMPVLNLVQGVFGKGMGYWLADFGAELHEIEVPYDEAVDVAAVEAHLEAHPEIELVVAVASETPSGTVSDIRGISEAAHRHGALVFLDVVSALGGMELDVDGWGLDVCVAGAQKCLGGNPGTAMVTVSPAGWEAIDGNPRAPRDSYVSLLDWRDKWLRAGAFPYTPTVSDVYGLEATCDVALEEGMATVIGRHERAAAVTRAGARAMGLHLWCEDGIAAACATSIRLPEDIDHQEFRTLVRERYGVMLSSGQGAGNLIRVGHMGPTARGLYPVVGVSAVARGVIDLGHPLDIGRGVDVMLEMISSQRENARDRYEN